MMGDVLEKKRLLEVMGLIRREFVMKGVVVRNVEVLRSMVGLRSWLLCYPSFLNRWI